MRVRVGGQGWSAQVERLMALEMGLSYQWTAEELKEYSTYKLVELFFLNSHRLNHVPSSMRRFNLYGLAGFSEVVVLSDGRLLYSPVNGGATRTVRLNPETGALNGIGQLWRKDYKNLQKATYLELTKMLLVPDDDRVKMGEILRRR